ncbi:MAG: LVIVD repeat-containing protein [Actinomycetota bacterium]
MRRVAIAVCSLALLSALLAPAHARLEARQGEEPAGSFELIGHNPLMNRGMNAALAVHGDYAYVGSRTDAAHPNTGVMILDISDPSAPEIVDQIPGQVGITTREMRIWPEQELLIVLDLATNCSPLIHACVPAQTRTDRVCVGQGITGVPAECNTFSFYDISGDKAAAPELVSQYVPTVAPHEFFLWDDPKRAGRALLYISSPGTGGREMVAADISKAREGEFTEIAEWSTVIPAEGDNRLHSFGVSNDGKRAYLAYLEGGFLVADISQVAKGLPEPEITLVTSMNDRPDWEGPGAHSAVKLYGRPFALVTDEVYGQIPGLLPDHGCPWGWVRVIDIKDPVLPKVVSEFKLPINEEDFCSSGDNPPDRNTLSSHSAHNPTLTRNLAFVTWHSEGLQAIDIKNPSAPVQAAAFMPDPLPAVVTEDPALSMGRDKVVMWSYPVIKDGLIYVVDVRNGFYVLKYSGPYESEVAKLKFLEGNSNLGDALKLEKP